MKLLRTKKFIWTFHYVLFAFFVVAMLHSGKYLNISFQKQQEKVFPTFI